MIRSLSIVGAMVLAFAACKKGGGGGGDGGGGEPLPAVVVAGDQPDAQSPTVSPPPGDGIVLPPPPVPDTTPPAEPTGLVTLPLSPANANAPRIRGTAEAGASVQVFTNAACIGSSVAHGSAEDFATSGLTVAVGDDSTTTFYATVTDAAGNVSLCSATGVTFVEDSTPPAMPTVTSAPLSPSADPLPKIKGTAVAGATVELHLAADCSDTAVGTGSAADFAGAGIAAAVTQQATSTVRARTKDDAGNRSACSTTSASYVHRSAFRLKDIRTDTVDSSSPANGVMIGAYAYFSANDGANGAELWRSDGTVSGTTLFKDINPIGSSSPTSIVDFGGGTFLFQANDGTNGAELWRSDGTVDGTMLVKDIADGPYSSSPANMWRIGSVVVFTANDPDTGTELWRTDGTEAGTYQLADIVPGAGSPAFSSGTWRVVGNLLYVLATDNDANGAVNGTELWATDGTTAGTVMFGLAAGTASAAVANQTIVGNYLYFTANDGNGSEVWCSDGSSIAAATPKIHDVNTTATSSSPTSLEALNGFLLFRGSDGTSGNELWRSDPTPGCPRSLTRVKDIRAGSSSSSPNNITALGSIALFSATGSTAVGVELWATDGTDAGTYLVADIATATNASSSPSNFVAFDGYVTFTANDGVHGVELWKSNGITAANGGTTVLLGDINPGAGGIGTLSTFTKVGPLLFFKCDLAASSTDLELCMSDGNTASRVEICAGSTTSDPKTFNEVNGRAAFLANDCVNGQELWVSDGTAAGTSLALDINDGPSNGEVKAFLKLNASTLLFQGYDADTTGRELFVTNGTVAGTTLFKDINAVGSSSPTGFVSLGGNVLFTATTAENGTELWSSNGTSGGTTLVKDILPGAANSTIGTLVPLGGYVYFSANDGTNGTELWRSDGTAAGTVMAADIAAGAGSSSPTGIVAFGGKLYFAANDGTTGTELWTYDPATTTASLLWDINPGVDSSSPSQLVAGVSWFYFRASNGTATGRTGIELYRSDGTLGGSVLIKDIRTGTGSSSPDKLKVTFGDRLFFWANDNLGLGNELWTSEGTTSSTVLVKDLNPGAGASMASTTYMVYLEGITYFTATNAANGSELWRTDGTEAGTYVVKDIRTGPANAAPTSTYVFDDLLWFRADDGVNGTELWRSDGTEAGTTMISIRAGAFGSGPTNFFAVDGRLMFTADDGVRGSEIMRVGDDGVSVSFVQELQPGILGSGLGGVVVIDDRAWFRASDGLAGSELWVY